MIAGDSAPALSALQSLSLKLGGPALVQHERHSANSPPQIVVIDDDRGVRQSLHTALSPLYRVLLGANDTDASTYVDSDTAAVILDVRMPGQDGFAVYERIRARLAHVPIIFYSAHQNLRDPFDIMNTYRPFAYISKGASLGTLLSTVAAAVEHYQEITRCNDFSKSMHVRLLKDILLCLRCDEVTFFTRRDGKVHPEAFVSAHRQPAQSTARVDVSLAIADQIPIFFDGQRTLPWPSAKEQADIQEGAFAFAPVQDGAQVIGGVLARWHRREIGVPGEGFAKAAHVAKEIAFTLSVADLRIEALHEQVERGNAEQTRLRAELCALQARVNPHFLYNTLNSIGALARRNDPRGVEKMVVELGQVFRHVLHHSESESIKVEDELRVVDAYLRIEAARLGERLHVVRDIDGKAMRCSIAPLLLLPLVENAINHGVSAAPRGAVTLSIARQRHSLVLSVMDTGPGATSSRHAGTGRSLENIRRRLKIHYGEDASLKVDHQRSGGFHATLRLPLRKVNS